MIDSNPDLVHGKDCTDGIALWAKQTTFTSLRQMKPRGYTSVKDVPVVPVDDGKKKSPKDLGFDPSRGKGELTKSVSQRSFAGLTKQNGWPGDGIRPAQPIQKFNSMAVRLGLRRVDSLWDLNEAKDHISEEEYPVAMDLKNLLLLHPCESSSETHHESAGGN